MIIVGGALGAVIFFVLLVMPVVLGVYFAIHPRPRLETHNLSDFGLIAQDVRFPASDGIILSGWFIKGESSKTIILAHGYARSRRELLLHADMLHRAGYNVLLFDSRNRGTSEGKFVSLGFQEHLDVRGAVQYLQSREDIKGVSIGVFGCSLGAVSSILAAVETPDIRAVVAEAPFPDLKRVVTRNAKNRLSYLPFFSIFLSPLVFVFVYTTLFVLRRKTGAQKNITPKNEIAKLAPRPVLLIHDEKDDLIPLEWGIELFEAASSPKELWIVPGAEHAKALETVPDEFTKKVVGFFNQYL